MIKAASIELGTHICKFYD